MDGRLGEQENLLLLPGIEPQFLSRPARSLAGHQILVGNIYVAFCGCDTVDTGIPNYVLRHFDFILYSNVKFDQILLLRASKLFLLCVVDLFVVMYISTRNKMYFGGVQQILSNLTLALYENEPL